MFADDTKLYCTIKCEDDATLLQSDLQSLEQWSITSGLSFNETKCKQQRVTRKIKPISFTFMLNDHQLQTDTERDLGVCVSLDLTWKFQVHQEANKANKMLGYIRRNTMFITSTAARRTLYLVLVGCHYGSPIRAPQTIELISMLERTQRRATKYILNLPFLTNVDYNTRLQSLHLLPISY